MRSNVLWRKPGHNIPAQSGYFGCGKIREYGYRFRCRWTIMLHISERILRIGSPKSLNKDWKSLFYSNTVSTSLRENRSFSIRTSWFRTYISMEKILIHACLLQAQLQIIVCYPESGDERMSCHAANKANGENGWSCIGLLPYPKWPEKWFEQQDSACCSPNICSCTWAGIRICSIGTSKRVPSAYRLSTVGRLSPFCHL